ncbi:ABC-F family ATP-binding cassette domain-containing protein [Rhodoflexus caldus]|uniref:ABC-F family ATP-binding cassette domain-containing protein n=1 Tax=Rhodoflexus caldus TaxID=2891236 RepID=UPI00202A48A5|nr:ABC-F family ATP-binding cassette domain-containing protein [Rhodoflexus caldus]
MNIISADNIGKTFDGERWLFRNLTFGLSQGEKVALVGVNGSGKTTLMNMLAGLIPPDEGTVSVRKDVRMGYLTQNPVFDERATVWQAVFQSEHPALAAVQAYERAMRKGDEAALQKALEGMETPGAWELEYKMKEILGKLGLHDTQQPVAQLSGGQRKRLALAQLLMSDAELMILDEPTNHLDLDTIEWLEGVLATANRTILLVTHDRYFLDRVANVVLELDGGKVYRYAGNYGYFLEKKEERMQTEAAAVDKARNLMRTELEWIRRQPKARTTKAKFRVDAFEDLKERAAGKAPEKKLEINAGMARQGKKIIEVEHLYKAFGDKIILKDFSYTFRRSDKIGIVGENGVGKTTFLKLLTGELPPDRGTVDMGQNTVIGYYTQQELIAPPDLRIIDSVKAVAEVITTGTGETITASQLLNLFRFPPSVQYTPVSRLSGGEKRRLQLLHVLMKNPNFLILDEPTNDLDILTLNILEDFLANFGGCLLIVSHDRYFLDRLVEHLFVFEGNGTVRDFPGNYTDYRNHLAEEQAARAALQEKTAKATPTAATTVKAAGEKRRLSFKEKQEYERLEGEIAALEQEKTDIENLLSTGNGTAEDFARWGKRLQELTPLIDEKTMRWLELAEMA